MDIKLPSGKYVLAVSGGVDSVALLDLLAKKTGVELVVAHFDHGIRPNSSNDAVFVQTLAKKYDLEFIKGEGKLGPKASEEKARNARYAFLRDVMAKDKLEGIITAHHQDDLIETALINLVRGTGSAGLISLSNNTFIKRPLLGYSKQQIVNYAKKHKLKWREDETNQSTQYMRNYLRLEVIPRMKRAQRKQLLANIDKVSKNKKQSDLYFATLSQYIEANDKIKRVAYSQLENRLAEEYLYRRLRELGNIDRRTVSRINIAIKTAKPGLRTNIISDKYLVADKEYAWVE